MQKTITVTDTNFSFQLDIETKKLAIHDAGTAAIHTPSFVGRRKIDLGRRKDDRLNAFVDALVRSNWRPRSAFRVPAAPDTKYIWLPTGELYYVDEENRAFTVNASENRFNIIRSLLKKL